MNVSNTLLFDVLTGAYQHQALQPLLEHAVDHASIEAPVCILALDIDHFKTINDAFGHRRGDEILAGAVERIKATLRTADHVIRRGGDEFVVLLPDTSAEQGLHVAQRVLESIAGQPFAGLPPIRLTVSIGVAAFPADAPSSESLLERADQRSYYAKRTGRGQVIAIDDHLHHSPSWSPERLYDRDHIIHDLNAILSSLHNERRICVHVEGDPGLGRTRLLQEAEYLARLRGYATLCLSGKAALRQRVFGVFAHRDSFWSTLPHPALGSQTVATALQQQLEQHHFAGLVLLLDDTDEFDGGTRTLVYDLITSDTIERVLVIAVGMTHSLPLDACSSIHTLRLAPLTEPSIRAWLRHVLQWEPPLALVQWVKEQSHGIPVRITHLLPKLIEHSILTHHPTGWTLHEHRFDSVTPWLGSFSFNPHAAFDRILRDQNDFVGREHDLLAIRRLLRDHRIVCLCGPGGMGKTRLAVQAAAESTSLYRDGVYWVSCATLAHSAAVLNAIADAVGLERTSTTDTFERLADACATRQLLIVLDNIEQMISEFGALAALLDRAPQLSLLATSRIAPRFGGAVTRQVGGLPVPEQGADPGASEAGQLFLHCARRVDANFLPTPEDNAAIAEICWLVDGLPLGIELAAAQINEVPPRAIAATLRDGWRDSRARHSYHDRHHQSLALVIDSFWRLLSRSEQRVLSRLGLFQDGFLAEAGRLVADASPFFLHALVASGYLRRSGNGRYQLQELLHQDAFQRLQQHPADLQRVAKRHAVYYLRFVQEREDALFRNQTAKDDIRAEYANIRAAWRWCVAHDVAEVVYAARGLVRFSLATGHLRDASAALEDALAALPPVESGDITHIAVRAKLEVQQSVAVHGLSRYDDSVTYAELGLEHAIRAEDDETIALAHLACADALIMLTRFAAAQHHVEACLQIARTNQYAWIEAMALMARAYTANALRKYDDTLHDLAASLACFQSIGDLRGEAAALAGIGNIAEERGDTSAQLYYEKALERYRLVGDREGECGIIHNLGVVQVLTGQYTGARDELELARKTFVAFGNLFGVGLAHYNLGRVARDTSDWHLALSYFETALAMFERLGIRELEVATLNARGNTYFLVGDHEQASAAYDQALTCADPVNDRRNTSRVRASMARVELRMGAVDAALHQAQQALDLARLLDHALFESDALVSLGLAQIAAGSLELADAALAHALVFQERVGHPTICLEAYAARATIAHARGDHTAACRYIQPILKALAEHPLLPGRIDRGYVLWTVYQILLTSDPGQAIPFLHTANQLLATLATRIGADDGNQALWQAIPEHMWLAQHADQLSASSTLG